MLHHDSTGKQAGLKAQLPLCSDSGSKNKLPAGLDLQQYKKVKELVIISIYGPKPVNVKIDT